MAEKPLQISNRFDNKKSSKNNQSHNVVDEHNCICCIYCPDETVTPATKTGFDKIKLSSKIRKEQGKENEQYLQIETKLPDSYNPEVHGYHRSCYGTYTNTKRIEQRFQQSNNSDELSLRTTPK